MKLFSQMNEMHKKLLNLFKLTLLFLSINASVKAQGYSISVEIPDAPDSTIFLAHHFNGQILVSDTITLSHSGTGVFQGDSLLDQGLYVLYLNQNNFTDFLLANDQQFKIKHRFAQPTQMQIEGARETDLFNQYKSMLNRMKEQQQLYVQQRKQYESNPDSTSKYNTLLEQLNTKITDYWFSEEKKYPDSFYSRMLLANYIPAPQPKDIPEAAQHNDSLRWVFEYNFRKNHYWDYFDVSDPRLLRTPFFKPRLENFFDQVLLQRPDSVVPYALQLIEKSHANPKSFRYVTSFLLNHFLESKVMGMEAGFVQIAQKYYLTGIASWADSASLASIGRQVMFKRLNQLDMIAPELKLERLEGSWISLHETKSPYIILVFWEPNCGHCQTQIPELYNNVFLPLKDRGVILFAVNTQTKRDEWEKFINEKKMYEAIHCWDPDIQSNFRIEYDVQSTPMIYILDKNKKIIAKKIDPKTVKEILEQYLSMN